MLNQRIVVVLYNEDRSRMDEEIHCADRSLTEKEFKKWYNHICSITFNNKNADVVDVFAVYEDEDGDTCEMAQYWGILEMSYNPRIPF